MKNSYTWYPVTPSFAIKLAPRCITFSYDINLLIASLLLCYISHARENGKVSLQNTKQFISHVAWIVIYPVIVFILLPLLCLVHLCAAWKRHTIILLIMIMMVVAAVMILHYNRKMLENVFIFKSRDSWRFSGVYLRLSFCEWLIIATEC